MNFEVAKSKIIIQLLKGPLYRDLSPSAWQHLSQFEVEISEYYSHMGLSLFIHQDYGFAFLKQAIASENTAAEDVLPRLVQQRELSFELSLLLALLRKKLAEHDSTSGDPRVVLDEKEILHMLKIFLQDTNNEVKQKKEVDALIEKAIDIGVLRRMNHDSRKIEILRVLAALFDATRLNELDQRLKEYEAHANQST